ncbi:MAG TPA: MarR family transcriptional regulator [Chthoniobacterales bacterium]|jgi:DNA-binding MarR family transcriptional regulator
MREPVTLLKALPRYDVFLEDTKDFPHLDASACYTFLQLLKTGDELLALDNQILSTFGTRHGRFNLLMMLKHCTVSTTTPADLAEKAGVTRATITGLLDGLERDGFVERCPDPGNRRSIQVKLTATGQEFLEKVRPGYCRWFTSVVEPLNQDERQQLLVLLEKIQIRLGEISNQYRRTANQIPAQL